MLFFVHYSMCFLFFCYSYFLYFLRKEITSIVEWFFRCVFYFILYISHDFSFSVIFIFLFISISYFVFEHCWAVAPGLILLAVGGFCYMIHDSGRLSIHSLPTLFLLVSSRVTAVVAGDVLLSCIVLIHFIYIFAD